MKVKSLSILMLAVALFVSACGGKSDADLQKAATDKLVADKVAGVTVSVKDGVATLAGEVADVTVKSKAEASVKLVEGIKSVTNGLTTKPLPTPVAAPADPMLKGRLEEALKKAGCTGAIVETADGKITLKGTVPTAKYTECIQVAQQSGGMGIDNQLQKGK